MTENNEFADEMMVKLFGEPVDFTNPFNLKKLISISSIKSTIAPIYRTVMAHYLSNPRVGILPNPEIAGDDSKLWAFMTYASDQALEANKDRVDRNIARQLHQQSPKMSFNEASGIIGRLVKDDGFELKGQATLLQNAFSASRNGNEFDRNLKDQGIKQEIREAIIPLFFGAQR